MSGAVWTALAAFCTGATAALGLLTLLGKGLRRGASALRERRDRPVLQAIEAVSRKVDENERDRLRQEIFRYGNFARRRMPISSEEFRYLQTCYEKYARLGGNDIAHDEYELVRAYYDREGGPA